MPVIGQFRKAGGLAGALLALTAIAACVLNGQRADPAAPGCRQVTLEPRPRWVFFGYWTEDGHELVLADVLAGRLLRYDHAGSYAGSVARPGKSLLEFDRPIELIESDGNVMLINRTDHVLGLDDNLEPEWAVRLRDLTLPGSEHLTFLRSVIPVGEQELVGLLNLDGGESGPWWGFGRVMLGNSPAVDRIQRLPGRNTPEGDLYSMTMPLVAKVGTAVFALRLEDEPHIQRLLPSPHRLAAFPSGYQAAILPPARGPSSDEGRYRALESAAMPVALFSRGQLLYVLTRKPRGEGGTVWILHQIDPERDTMIRSILIPTHASHLVVVPGPSDWAFIEKGSVGPGAEQHIGPMLLIPSSWIEDSLTGVPLAGDCLSGAPS